MTGSGERSPEGAGSDTEDHVIDAEQSRERRKYTVTVDLWANDDTGAASASIAVKNHQGGHSLERHPIVGYDSVSEALEDAVSEAGAYMRDIEDIDNRTES